MRDKCNNIDVAILTKINDLASRYRLKPYHFIATLDHALEVGGLGVRFIIPGETINRAEAQVVKMLKSLGVNTDGALRGDDVILKGGEIAVIEALDNALSVAPRPRPRA